MPDFSGLTSAMSNWILFAAKAILAAEVVVPQSINERFQQLVWRSDSDANVCHYRLYEPDQAGDGRQGPLLIWLHGEGERGNDNVNHLRWLNLVFSATNNSPPLYILAVQHPYDKPWFSADDPQADTLSVICKILGDVVKQHSIDPDRIYLSGVSSGGTASWELACRHPELFAAVAPMASSGGDPSKASRLAQLPIWAFYSRTDKKPIDGVRAMVEGVNFAGGNAKLTETDQKTSSRHDCWTPAFEDHQLLNWLLAQKRGILRSGASETGPSPPANANTSTDLFDFNFLKWTVLVAILGLAFVYLIRFVMLNEGAKSPGPREEHEHAP